MALDYLDFDYSEDDEGTATWDALASVAAERLPALTAEVEQLLGWAHRAFAGRRGPIEEGGDWDYDLHGMQEMTAPEALHYDAATRQLSVEAGPPGKSRHTLTLSLSGTPAFCEAFIQQFGLNTD